MGASTSQSSSCSPPQPLYCTVSGKATQPPTSWRGWKARTWWKLLSGMTLKPCGAARGVGRWIASLPDTHVNRSHWRDDVRELKTHGTFGRASSESSKTSGQGGASSRMSPTILNWDSTRSPETYKSWVSQLRRASSARRKSALLISESGSLSWPTPKADRSGSSQNGVNRTRPSAGTPSLETYGRQWPTPTQRDFHGSSGNMNRSWGQMPDMIRQWPTPTMTDAKCSGSRAKFSSNTHPGTALTDAVVRQDGFRQEETQKTQDGGTGPGQRINPDFVEALMGLPSGWTDCDSRETGWSHYKEHMRSALCCLLSKKKHLEAQ